MGPLPLLVFLAAWLAEPQPLVVLLADRGDAWKTEIARRGWELAPAAALDDAGINAIEEAVEQAVRQRQADPARVYLAGEGSPVFYLISRRPHLWAAAVALGGGPEQAIETNRLFGANAQLVPLLWIAAPEDRSDATALRNRLAAAGFLFAPESDGAGGIAQALDWLSRHKSEPYPQQVDCETADAAPSRCYWVEFARLDPARRNDALPSSHIAPGSSGSLALGAFGFRTVSPGPGVLIESLPAGYKGPLKLGDRIVSIGGRAITDARHYLALMSEADAEKATGVLIQRGNERLRVETRILVNKPPTPRTARVRAEFLQDAREIWVASRGVAELRLRVPAHWTPTAVNWNGQGAGTIDAAGCWKVGEGVKVSRCE